MMASNKPAMPAMEIIGFIHIVPTTLSFLISDAPWCQFCVAE